MNQDNTQASKTALVTGSARRIGAVLVKSLHQAGYQVIIHCHSALDQAKVLAKELNSLREHSAFVLRKDLRKKNFAQEMIEEIKNWTDGLDLLINNASVFHPTCCSTLGWDEQVWETLFDTNVKAPFLLSLAAYPLLKKQQGVIINITDIHADKALKGYSEYSQTQAALKMQTQTLAREWAPLVRVNAIAPGAILWPEEENALSVARQEKIIEHTPLKRQGSPEHIAQAVLALAQNSFITGQTLRVDGGRSLK